MAKVYWNRGIRIRRANGSGNVHLGSLDSTVGSTSAHYLAFKKDNTVYYLPLVTPASGNLRLRKGSTTYSIDNKYRIRLNVNIEWYLYDDGTGYVRKQIIIDSSSSSGIDILAPSGSVISGTDMDITVTPISGGTQKAWFYANGSKRNNFYSETLVVRTATTATLSVTVVRGTITAMMNFSVNCSGNNGHVSNTYIYIDII